MRTLTIIAAAFLIASPLAATCRSTAENLLATHNCGFDRDVSEWTAFGDAAVSRDASEGGVLKAVSDASGSLTIDGPCVAAKAASQYRLSARLRLSSGTTYFCSVNVYQYSDAECGQNADPLGSAAGPPDPVWTVVDGTATTSSTTKSLKVHPDCSGQPGFVVLFDDFVLVSG